MAGGKRVVHVHKGLSGMERFDAFVCLACACSFCLGPCKGTPL